MKRLIPAVWAVVWTGSQVVAVAQPAHVHAHPGAHEPTSMAMKTMRDEMPQKLASTNTETEHAHTMAAHRSNMQGMHGQMHAQMGVHDHGGMASADPEMHKRMQSMHGQMAK